jgi:lipopolysaccharide export system permease protein
MKKILFRKLMLDCIIFFLIALISVSVIIWVFQAVNFLDIMIEDGRDYLVYFSYSFLNLPKIISKLMPFALFFSFFYVISKYEINNELLIFWNFGVTKFELINFFSRFSLIILLLQILFTTLIVPSSQNLARSFLRDSNFNFFENFIKPKKFNDNIKGLTIYSEKKDNNDVFYNLYLKNNTGDNNFQITYAKKGVFKKINNTSILRLLDGQTISKVNNEFTNISFAQSDLNLSNSKSNTTTYKKTQELSSLNLVQCLDILYNLKLIKFDKKNFKVENCESSNLNNLIKELYKRIIIPLYIPALILTALLLIIKSKENINFTRQRIIIFMIGLFIIIFSETTLRFVQKELIENLKIVIIPLILILIIYLVFYNFLRIRTLKIK